MADFGSSDWSPYPGWEAVVNGFRVSCGSVEPVPGRPKHVQAKFSMVPEDGDLLVPFGGQAGVGYGRYWFDLITQKAAR